MNSFDLNALFGKVLTKPKKEKDSIVPEATEIEISFSTKVDSLKFYEQLNQKVAKMTKKDPARVENLLPLTIQGTENIKEFASDPKRFSEKIEDKIFLLDKFVKPRQT